MPSEKNSEEYSKAFKRRRWLKRSGVWNWEQLEEWKSAERAMLKEERKMELARERQKEEQLMAMARQNMRGTREDFEKMHELIGYALKAREDGLIKKWDDT